VQRACLRWITQANEPPFVSDLATTHLRERFSGIVIVPFDVVWRRKQLVPIAQLIGAFGISCTAPVTAFGSRTGSIAVLRWQQRATSSAWRLYCIPRDSAEGSVEENTPSSCVDADGIPITNPGREDHLQQL